MARSATTRIYTLGHSDRSLKEFIAILKDYRLKLVIDVRKIPKSLRNPQFKGTRLKASLKRHGIEYVQMAGLGGRRPPQKESENKGWRNRSFQGYADYMQTDEFKKSLRSPIAKAKRKRLVLVCAEAVPWRCHRSLIADALVAQGIPVEEIFSETSHRPHKLTPFAQVRGSKITYPFDPRDQAADEAPPLAA